MKTIKVVLSVALVAILSGCGSLILDPYSNNNERAANRSAKNVMDATTWQQNYAAAQGCPAGYEDAGSRINRNTQINNTSRVRTGGIRNPLFVTPDRRYDVRDRVNKQTRCKKIEE